MNKNYFSHERINMEQFNKLFVLKRIIYTSGRVKYIGTYKNYIEEIILSIHEKEDISYYDIFARDILQNKIIQRINT